MVKLFKKKNVYNLNKGTAYRSNLVIKSMVELSVIFNYTPVHLVESENYTLCMRQCILCSSNMSVTHSALAFMRANRTDASTKH